MTPHSERRTIAAAVDLVVAQSPGRDKGGHRPGLGVAAAAEQSPVRLRPNTLLEVMMPEAALEVVSNPITLFRQWLQEATASEVNDPNAMTLATASRGGMPSARMVLLKDVDDRGFVFYTNTQSRKAEQLAETRMAALLFHWKTLRRQVRIEGPVEPVTEAEADAYFASRPRISRLGAIASDQSRPLPERAELERRLADAGARYPGDDVPRPAHWSGYRVLPDIIEFWQDMPYRLHDRMVYRRESEVGWQTTRLFP